MLEPPGWHEGQRRGAECTASLHHGDIWASVLPACRVWPDACCQALIVAPTHMLHGAHDLPALVLLPPRVRLGGVGATALFGWIRWVLCII